MFLRTINYLKEQGTGTEFLHVVFTFLSLCEVTLIFSSYVRRLKAVVSFGNSVCLWADKPALEQSLL